LYIGSAANFTIFAIAPERGVKMPNPLAHALWAVIQGLVGTQNASGNGRAPRVKSLDPDETRGPARAPEPFPVYPQKRGRNAGGPPSP
jgi:hypothetical protein